MAENDVEENLDPGPVSEPGEVQQMEGVVTVVLTADNHLGYAGLSQHPRKREECRQRLRHAFQMATDFAVNQGVDLFIQAGDLFDTANPDERDRSFVAERLAQLRKASIRTFALGGVHDTPVSAHSTPDRVSPAPQISFARLGALHYFAPQSDRATAKTTTPMEPVIFDVQSVRVGICGLAVVSDQVGDPLAHLRVQDDIEGTAISLLVLHAPIGPGGRFILAGYTNAGWPSQYCKADKVSAYTGWLSSHASPAPYWSMQCNCCWSYATFRLRRS